MSGGLFQNRAAKVAFQKFKPSSLSVLVYRILNNYRYKALSRPNTMNDKNHPAD
jgi:hypothetical protein